MKKNRKVSVVVAFLCMLVGIADVQAQTLGFKLGAASSTASTDATEGTISALTRFTGGGFVQFGIGRIAVQPGLMYVTKGIKHEFPLYAYTGELDYLEVPILLVVPIPAVAAVSPYLQAGPAFAFEVGCSFNTTTALGESSNYPGCEGTESFEPFSRRSFDIGVMLGGGLSLPVGPGALLLEGHYNLGTVNIFDDANASSFRHRSGAVLMGYSVRIGRSRPHS